MGLHYIIHYTMMSLLCGGAQQGVRSSSYLEMGSTKGVNLGGVFGTLISGAVHLRVNALMHYTS